MCSAAGTVMGTLSASGARDSLCTIEPTFSAELSTMLLRLASVGPLRSIMDNVGNGIRRGPAQRSAPLHLHFVLRNCQPGIHGIQRSCQ